MRVFESVVTGARHDTKWRHRLRTKTYLSLGAILGASASSLVLAPLPAGATTPSTIVIADPAGSGLSGMGGLSCATAAFCVGVAPGTAAPVLETLSSSTWTASLAPIPAAAASADLNDVSCPTTTWCLAVGSYQDAAGDIHTLAEQFNGATWSILTGTDPTGLAFTGLVDTGFSGVDCVSPGVCTAVGYWSPSSFNAYYLASSLQAGAWTPATGPNPSGDPYQFLFDVDCASSTACVAVGAANTGQPLPVNHGVAVEEVSAGNWIDTTNLPNAAGNNASYLSGISCPAAGQCVAAGYTEAANDTGGGVYSALAETYSTGGWQVASTPSVGGINSELTDVACQSATSCQAVGWALPDSGSVKGMTMTLAGSAWAAQTGIAVQSASSQPALLQSTACPTGGVCQTLGYYYDTSFAVHGFAFSPPVDFVTPASGSLAELANGSVTIEAVGNSSIMLSRAGPLPAGLHFQQTSSLATGATATISGTPAAFTAGTYTVTIQAADSSGDVSDQLYSLVVTPDAANAPTVTAVTPADGGSGAPGRVTVAGTKFEHVSSVNFGGIPGTNVVVSGATLRVDPPQGYGVEDVTVTTNEGTSSISPADEYTYALPTVTSVSPNAGAGGGGTKVTIKGTNMQGVFEVDFGAVAGTLLSVNTAGTSVTVESPAGGTGAVSVTVQAASGISPANPSDIFTYVPPVITSLVPATQVAGKAIVIEGHDLLGTESVTFGATPATNFAVLSNGKVKVWVPAGSGVVTVTVTTSSGSSTANAGTQFTYEP